MKAVSHAINIFAVRALPDRPYVTGTHSTVWVQTTTYTMELWWAVRMKTSTTWTDAKATTLKFGKRVVEESHGNSESEQRVCRPTDEAVTSQIGTNRNSTSIFVVVLGFVIDTLFVQANPQN